MKEFNAVEFHKIVKNYKETMKHVTSDAQVKFQICQAAIDNGFSCADIINHIYDLWTKTYPDFIKDLNSRKWDNVLKHYILEAEAEYDWETAKLFKDILTSVKAKGRTREEQLRTRFFSLIEEMGFDSELMEKDMCIDLWGWIQTMDLIIYLAEVESASPMSEKESAEEVCVADTCAEPSKDIVAEIKVKKSRTRIKYIEIHKYSLSGELLGRFKSITEAAKAGNHNHASISKCVKGTYKTAEGFVWKGITDPADLLKDAA